MARPPHTTRRDLVIWAAALVLAAVATAIGSVAGARLGAALSGGVIVLVATVLVGLALDERRG
jgi:uncharacterized membrane-anchored protein